MPSILIHPVFGTLCKIRRISGVLDALHIERVCSEATQISVLTQQAFEEPALRVNGPGFEIHAGVLRFQRRFRKLFVVHLVHHREPLGSPCDRRVVEPTTVLGTQVAGSVVVHEHVRPS